MRKTLFAAMMLPGLVSAQTIEPPLPALVDGDYWQVQIAVSPWTTICEGEALDGSIIGCTLGDGTYNVINHTTGERFEGIVVDGFDTPEFTVTTITNACIATDDAPEEFQEAVLYDECTATCETGSAIAVQCRVTELLDERTLPFESRVSGADGVCYYTHFGEHPVIQIEAQATCL